MVCDLGAVGERMRGWRDDVSGDSYKMHSIGHTSNVIALLGCKGTNWHYTLEGRAVETLGGCSSQAWDIPMQCATDAGANVNK